MRSLIAVLLLAGCTSAPMVSSVNAVQAMQNYQAFVTEFDLSSIPDETDRATVAVAITDTNALLESIQLDGQGSNKLVELATLPTVYARAGKSIRNAQGVYEKYRMQVSQEQRTKYDLLSANLTILLADIDKSGVTDKAKKVEDLAMMVSTLLTVLK